MNGLIPDLSEIEAIADAVDGASAEVVICPPAILIERSSSVVSGRMLRIGGQDCHPASSGAHTGDVSAEMLAAVGATYVILGHSERRSDHGETSAMVAAKAVAAYRAGLTAIICVGETEQERACGTTLSVVEAQLATSLPDAANASNTAIAYEPIWAIGTGQVPTDQEIGEVHAAIRAVLSTKLREGAREMRILYGGSVKPSNAKSIFAIPGVDGALVGGASLKASDFISILSAAPLRET